MTMFLWIIGTALVCSGLGYGMSKWLEHRGYRL